jgi:pimeloyl-ACP methyl ester carboxylesterase
LRTRFGAHKVILIGHSYGSTLGALVAARRPDLVRAYVGVGQVACARREELDIQKRWILDQAHKRGDTDTMNLVESGKPFDHESLVFQYGGGLAHATSFVPLLMTGLRAPEYSLLDAFHVKKGIDFTHANLKNDVYTGALMNAVPKIAVPVYLFEGRNDYTAPTVCAVAFLKRLSAPEKQIVWFEQSAHFPFYDEPEKFHAALLRVAAQTQP